MATPLSDNPDHVRHICSLLDIGASHSPLSRVYGGFHHQMWRLETNRDVYAVKQLSADTDLSKPEVINHYNVTEAIAETFSHHGINSVFALKAKTQYLLVVDDAGYLVYPWSDATSLESNQSSEKHALKIAAVLAQMHRANIDVSGLKDPEFDVYPEEKINELIRRANECRLPKAKALDRELSSFINIHSAYLDSIKTLKRHVVVSHGDLDQKNVLWDASGNPVLIDWENARKLNPTYEIVLEALDWAGITSEFDASLFSKIISAYQMAGGLIERESFGAAFHCILGEWLNWLLYNVARCIDPWHSDQCTLGAEQIDLVLPTILRLKRFIPELLEMEELWDRVCASGQN